MTSTKDNTHTGIDQGLLADYVNMVRQMPESLRPIWVAYRYDLRRHMIQLEAVVSDEDQQARFCLYDIQAKLNARSNDFYCDTVVYEVSDEIREPDNILWHWLYRKNA